MQIDSFRTLMYCFKASGATMNGTCNSIEYADTLHCWKGTDLARDEGVIIRLSSCTKEYFYIWFVSPCEALLSCDILLIVTELLLLEMWCNSWRCWVGLTQSGLSYPKSSIGHEHFYFSKYFSLCRACKRKKGCACPRYLARYRHAIYFSLLASIPHMDTALMMYANITPCTPECR